MTPAVLHISPHPDDELIGAPATLMALRDCGWRVVDLACGLGHPEQRARREAELRQACDLAGFELRLPPAVAEAERPLGLVALRAAISAALEAVGPALVVSPGLCDRHPAHELVARAARDALEAAGEGRWWMWGLWGQPPRPTLATAFGEERLAEILTALAAHRGELARNDYRRLVRGRAEANAVLAPELLFGFGAEAPPGPPFAELLAEVALTGGRWVLGAPRWLDPAEPLIEPSAVALRDLDQLADVTGPEEGGLEHPAVGEVEGAPGE